MSTHRSPLHSSLLDSRARRRAVVLLLWTAFTGYIAITAWRGDEGIAGAAGAHCMLTGLASLVALLPPAFRRAAAGMLPGFWPGT